MSYRFTPAQVLLIGFACIILIGTILLSFPFSTVSGKRQPIIDSLFTATSAVCVTGLVVKDTGNFYSLFGQITILFLLQVGALGYMTMATILSLIIGKKISLREKIIIKEAFDQLNLGDLVSFVKYIVKVTFFIEIIGAMILTLRWMGDFSIWNAVYMGIFHSISAFCNAGFDVFGRVHGPFSSLSAYKGDVVINLTMSCLIILGGLGYIVLSDFYQYFKVKKISLHSKIVLLFSFSLIVFGTIIFFVFEYNNSATLGSFSWEKKILMAFFQSVSTRTAGFSTVNISWITSGTLFIAAFLMIIGASPGGTGGGIKTTTFGVMIAAMWATITKKKEVTFFNRRIANEIVRKSFVVGFLSIIFISVITVVMLVTEKEAFIKVFFEVISAFGTVGLSTGITPTLSSMGKMLIIFTMYAGRLGPLTLGVAVLLQDKGQLKIQYPLERVFVG
ncbi:Trk family potassium uptake protein [bacterium]|nr:Trk family potassium uptake protein [bacterium]